MTEEAGNTLSVRKIPLAVADFENRERVPWAEECKQSPGASNGLNWQPAAIETSVLPAGWSILPTIWTSMQTEPLLEATGVLTHGILKQ